MVQRRSLLKGALAWPIATTLAACSPHSRGLRIKLLSQSVPVQVVSAFQRTLKSSSPPTFSSEANLQELFALLQRWNSPNPPKGFWGSALPSPDLMTLGDAWLGDAIRQNLIQPWTLDHLEGWDTLNDRYRALVQRNAQGLLDPTGEIWGLPYRWGTTAIAYRRSAFKAWGWEPQDWSDLWRSDLQGQIGLPDDPREVIGLTLKSLGHSYNTLSPEAPLQERLLSLHQQVKFYSSTHLVQPLLVQDVALIVGWSTDLLPLTNLDRDIEIMLPQSGTALWADLWVRPTPASQEPLEPVKNWVNFCWQTDMVSLFRRFGAGTSPLDLAAQNSNSQPENVGIHNRFNDILSPSAQWLDRCEFLLPLPPASQAIYQRLWIQMRNSTKDSTQNSIKNSSNNSMK